MHKNDPATKRPAYGLWVLAFFTICGAPYAIWLWAARHTSTEEVLSRTIHEYQKKNGTLRNASSGEKEQHFLTDKNRIAKGKSLFAHRCAVCHGADGGGLVGPNLTDAYWIHGDGSPQSIAAIVEEGSPAKGMPPWAHILSRAEITDVTLFVGSLQGTTPAGAKSPQGVLVKTR